VRRPRRSPTDPAATESNPPSMLPSTTAHRSPVEEEPIHIVGIVEEGIGQPQNDGTPGSALYRIPLRLSRRPSSTWARHFIETWNHAPRFTTMHRPGIASVSGDTIILDGSTMEELEALPRRDAAACARQGEPGHGRARGAGAGSGRARGKRATRARRESPRGRSAAEVRLARRTLSPSFSYLIGQQGVTRF
jgi:hypothetical protein